MNPLQLRLASLRFRLYMVTFWRGMCGIFALVVGTVLLGGLLDYAVNLPSVVRALLLVGMLGSAGYVFLRYLAQPLTGKFDDLALALRIEEMYPELNDALASTVQFLEETPGSAAHSSPALRKQAIEQAMKLADDCDFNRILDHRGVGLLTLAALLTGLAGAYFQYQHPSLSLTALVRLADPFGGHTWTRLAIPDCPHRVAQGQPFTIKGEVAGIIPNQARLEIEGRPERIIPIKLDLAQQIGTLVAPLDMTQQRGKFRFRLLANDAAFPFSGTWHEVEVLPPPRLALLDGMPSPQLELHFPAYTDLPSPKKLSPGQGHVDAVVGTQVTWRAAVDRPLAEAWFEMQPENTLIKPLLQFGPLGHAQLLDMLSLTVLGQTVTGRIPCQLDEGGTQFTIHFLPWLQGSYQVHFRDPYNLANDYKNELRIFADPPPQVQLQRPSSSQSLLPDALVTLQMAVEDEVFAIRSVFLEYRRKNAEGQWLDQEPQRVPIYQAELLQSVVNSLFELANRNWYSVLSTQYSVPGLTALSTQHSALRLRPKRLELASRWPLREQFKAGETVVLQVCADDFNDLFTPRAVGRSHEIELRIVGKNELARQMDEDFAKIQQDLVRLQQLQDDALNMVKEVQKNREKAGKTNHDKLVEAEQIQRQIQERVGPRPDEGLRQDLANMQQKLRDNQLSSSDLQDRIRGLNTELDRLTREDLQQIEAKLAQARKDLAGNAKPTPQNKDALDQAKVLQEDAKKTLDDLAKFLDPWANLHQIKGRTRDLLSKQKELKKETDALVPKTNEIPASEELKGELGKKAEAQNSLAQQSRDLVQMMKEVQEKQKGTDTGQKVAEAARVAEKAELPEKMGEIRDMLRNTNQPKLNEASQKQQETIDQLKKMLAALEEERREEEIDKLRKKQKETEKKLDQIAQDMEKLQKKVKEANQNPNPEQRTEELKKLAGEQEKLKEQAQEEARELARLRAEQASKAMARAAQEMEKAGRKLEAGENPEEAQEEALQRLDEAQAQLEEAEEELAREQLARIADRLKGLKERQDAAVAESERIHKELERKNQWTKGLLGSLKEAAGTQKGLAQEVDSLKEKLKDAKVFEHILERAGQTMTRAAEAIDQRREDKAFDPLEKEEMAAEKQAQDKIVKLQKEAGGRLQRLLDALKSELEKPEAQAKAEDDQPPQGGEEGGQGMKLRGGDGIPPMAEIKALRDEQTEVMQKTKEFAQLHPEIDGINDEQKAELDQLRQDQTRIHELFNQVMNPKGEQP